MARLPRLSLPGYPHHVILRGNNRQAIFACPADYQTLLDLVEEHARKSGIAVHAYVLMSNHFHLLVTPESADSLPRMMQAVGRRYVRYFNDSQGRSGTLWEGRYRSTPIQTEPYLLACMAYIDLNPVRAGLVAEARDYPWSSHGHYIGLRSDRLITPHPLFWALRNTPFAREAAYAEMVRIGVSDGQRVALTESALGGWALGDVDFLADLQKRTDRRLVQTRVGRPPRKPRIV
ncbi:MAG: transposase [Polaromonas sp.]|uniref:REP-associated tyrosine transposase n=1 Tax=Polaromonas sp. TaxID=1869339 RepID=UPI00248A32ED|nr:transposase [Polaromonas sp.]MDI1237862.1 transposase [Polaromonas sp.]